MKPSQQQHRWISRADLNNNNTITNPVPLPVSSSTTKQHKHNSNTPSYIAEQQQQDEVTPRRGNNVPLSHHKTRPPPPKRPQSLPPMTMTTSSTPTTAIQHYQPLEGGGRRTVLPTPHNASSKLSAHFAPLSSSSPSTWVPLNVSSQGATSAAVSNPHNNSSLMVASSSSQQQPEAATNSDHLLRILNGGEVGRKMIPPTSVALDRLDELFSFIFSTYFTQQSTSSDSDPSDLLVRLQRRESLASSIRKIHQQQQGINKNGALVTVHQPPPTRDPVLSYYTLFKRLISERIKVSSRPIRVMESLIRNWQRRVLTVSFMSWRFQSKLSRTLWTRNVETCESKYTLKLIGWKRACFAAWRSHAHLKHKREHVLESEDTRTKLVHRMGRRIEELELENKILKETVARLSLQRREVEGDLKVMTEVVATRAADVHAPSDLYISLPAPSEPPSSQGGGEKSPPAVGNLGGGTPALSSDISNNRADHRPPSHTTLMDYILPSEPPPQVVVVGGGGGEQQPPQKQPSSNNNLLHGEQRDGRNRPSSSVTSYSGSEAPPRRQQDAQEDVGKQQRSTPRGRLGESTTTVVPHGGGARGSVTRGPNTEDGRDDENNNNSDVDGHLSSSRALSPLLPTVLLEGSLPLSAQPPAAATPKNTIIASNNGPPPKHSDVLNWVSVRCQMMLAFGAPPRRLTNFGSDFKDGVRLAYLLVSLGFSRTAARKTLRLRKKRRRAALIELKGSISSSDLSAISSSTEVEGEDDDDADPNASSSSPQSHVLLRARRQAELCGLVEEVSNPLLSIEAKEVLLTDALRCFIDLTPLIVVNPPGKDGSGRHATSVVVGSRTKRSSNNSVVAEGGNKNGGAFAELFEARISEPSHGMSSGTPQSSTRNDDLQAASSKADGGDIDNNDNTPSSLPPPTATSLPLLSSGPNYVAKVVFAIYQLYHTVSMNIAVRAPVSDEVGLLVVRHFFPEKEAVERNVHYLDGEDEGNDSGSGAVSSCQDDGEDALDIESPPRSPHGDNKKQENKVSGKTSRIGVNKKKRKTRAVAASSTEGQMELFRKEYPAEHYTSLYTDLAHSDTDSERDYKSLSVTMTTKQQYH